MCSHSTQQYLAAAGFTHARPADTATTITIAAARARSARASRASISPAIRPTRRPTSNITRVASTASSRLAAKMSTASRRPGAAPGVGVCASSFFSCSVPRYPPGCPLRDPSLPVAGEGNDNGQPRLCLTAEAGSAGRGGFRRQAGRGRTKYSEQNGRGPAAPARSPACSRALTRGGGAMRPGPPRRPGLHRRTHHPRPPARPDPARLPRQLDPPTSKSRPMPGISALTDALVAS